MLHTDHRSQARIHTARIHGMPLVELENDVLRVGILAGKGADIVSIVHIASGIDLAWRSPGGIRNPADVPTAGPELFRATYPGGWQEMFPNAGPATTVAGVAHSQHGEVFARPWDVDVVVDDGSTVAARFSIETHSVPCRIERTISLRAGDASFRVEERVINRAPVPVPVMWGHHITFGAPYLQPGMRIELPDGITVHPQEAAVNAHRRRVAGIDPFPWPVDPGNGLDLRTIPDPGTPSEMLFLSGFGDIAWYRIAGDETRPTCRVAWDGTRMPFLWLWQESGGATGYPWYGRLWATGLEPCTSMPGGLDRALDAGTVPILPAQGEWTFWLTFTASG